MDRVTTPSVSSSFIRANERYAWHGQWLLITNERGDCDGGNALAGYYFRETRHLRTLRLEINGENAWLCDSVIGEPESLHFSYVHPELAEFGGGGTGYSQDQLSRDARGIPHRAIDLTVEYRVGIASLDAIVRIVNRARESVDIDLAWILDADFADIQEGFGSREMRSRRGRSRSSAASTRGSTTRPSRFTDCARRSRCRICDGSSTSTTGEPCTACSPPFGTCAPAAVRS
jgi:hypothetical protein